ncbi:hypothetical protein WME95_12560 [Sorangium sp. So ce327]|jgi:hypothetical protein|uniref:hypothetical protein n=1 Tax=Sorangium sp. So ce327 TaxID=3133301 RepID=UPI003F5F07A1
MGVRFHDAPPPSKDDVSEVARRVRERALLWLRRRGYLDERAAEERSDETITAVDDPRARGSCGTAPARPSHSIESSSCPMGV